MKLINIYKYCKKYVPEITLIILNFCSISAYSFQSGHDLPVEVNNYKALTLGLFTFNFIAPYGKENTFNVEGSLLDKVSCQCMSDLQISISFKKLRSF